ncbi:MAG: SRPBCC family protein [Chloroflexi bacterium]|nr:MAG: SRPBCC family protein [Chloroflexota bacterium]
MKYRCELVINLPREQVIALFDNTENMYKWQGGLQSFAAISGEPGQPGAKSRMVYDMNGRSVTMIETITKRNLPDEFVSNYKAKGVMNWVHNYFYEDGPDKTRWVMDSEFKFSGMMRMLGVVMRSSFPKQTQETMSRFKKFAESV